MIRPVRLTDLFEVRRMPYARLILFNEITLAGGHRPLGFALRCALPFVQERRTLVYRERGLRGYVQGRCRPNSPEVDLVYLAAQPFRSGMNQPTDPDVWHHLVREFVVRMGGQGMERIYAPLSSNNPHDELFRQLGFQSYANRQVWRALTPDVAEGSALIALRPQNRRDPHSIQRLYESITPAAVVRAEGRTSRSWQLPVVRSRTNGVRQRSWVLGRDDVLRAALHVWQGSQAAVISLLIDPAERGLASSVLRFGLTQLAAAHQGAVYVLLPEYHGELGHDLSELGFEHLGDQRMTVKNTTVAVRKPLLRPVLDGSMEPVVRPSVSSSVQRSDRGSLTPPAVVYSRHAREVEG